MFELIEEEELFVSDDERCTEREYSGWTGFQVTDRVTPDPGYDSPMHLHTEYVSADGDVFRPWKSRTEVCIETLYMMIGFIGDWDENDIDYIQSKGAHNGMDCETGEMVVGPRCKSCGSPEARQFGEKLEMLCDTCIMRKEGRAYRRAPRVRMTQEVIGKHGFWAQMNEQRAEKKKELFHYDNGMMPMDKDRTDDPYMKDAPTVHLPLTREELDDLGWR